MTITASQRFSSNASNYAASEVHRSSPSLRRVHALFADEPHAQVCDVACGAGHFALSFAALDPAPARIVGVDPAPAMLTAFTGLAAERGVAVETVHSHAEAIPLPDASFDVVVSRLAPHHFADIALAVREMTRLTRPGGRVIVIDLEGFDDPRLDAINHELEVLHDPTHGRSYTAQHWRELFTAAGLQIDAFEPDGSERPGGVPVPRWCEIAGSGAEAEAAILRLLRGLDAETLAGLRIREDNGQYFMPVRTVLIAGKRPG